MPPYVTAILGFLTGLLPSLVQVSVSRSNAKSEKLKTALSAEAQFREQLITERATFVDELKQRAEEIKNLSERFSQVETENHRLHLSLIEMQKQYAEMELKQFGYVQEITRLKSLVENGTQITSTPSPNS